MSSMYDTSDEATGLPPLQQVEVEGSILALNWVFGVEGLVSVVDESDLPVRYLSVRGLIISDEGTAQWGQVHVAVPHDALRPMCEGILKALDDYEADTPSLD